METIPLEYKIHLTPPTIGNSENWKLKNFEVGCRRPGFPQKGGVKPDVDEDPAEEAADGEGDEEGGGRMAAAGRGGVQ